MSVEEAFRGKLGPAEGREEARPAPASAARCSGERGWEARRRATVLRRVGLRSGSPQRLR